MNIKGENLMSLNEYAKLCHQANLKWWHDPITMEYLVDRNIPELLMLCVSELSEAMEGYRKSLNDDKLPEFAMFDVELVDCLVRIFDLAGQRGIDLDKIFNAKMEYNSKRVDHTFEARASKGGKKF